jgi:uncharacterized protein YcgL (UPF0745 family)
LSRWHQQYNQSPFLHVDGQTGIGGNKIINVIDLTFRLAYHYPSGQNTAVMWCEIYRSSEKTGAYLYVEELDDFSRVPDSLLKLLGRLEHVMCLELTPQRSLAQADSGEVSRNLKEKGFFLQLPPAAYTQN